LGEQAGARHLDRRSPAGRVHAAAPARDARRERPDRRPARSAGKSRARDVGAGARRQPHRAVSVRGGDGVVRVRRPEPVARPSARPLRDPRARGCAACRVAAPRRPRNRAPRNASASGACAGGCLPPVRERGRTRRPGAGRGRMSADVTTAAAAAAAVGTGVLVAAPGRAWRLAGLAAWTGGCATLAVTLAPAGHAALYAAIGAAGLGAATALAYVFVRVPWSVAVAALACVPVRLHVAVGPAAGRLLVPLYVVVAGAALALGWQLLSGRDPRRRELGLFAWPLVLVVAWSGLALAWSGDRRTGALYLLLSVLPFALLAVVLARLPWAAGWAGAVYVQLGTMAVAFAAVGIWEYATRDTYLRPHTVAADAAAPTGWFYRVGSVFDDPSSYARFLVVAILAGLVLVLYAKSGPAWTAAGAVAVTWVGLVPTFSAPALLALGAGGLAAVVVLWRR